MSKAIHTEYYRGHKIEVFPDDNCRGPRDWDNAGTMSCWHRRYDLGDKHKYGSPRDMLEALAEPFYRNSVKAIEDVSDKTLWSLVERHYIVLPLYLYDHSGISISTGSFSCPWDSGQVGYIYMTRKRARKEWGLRHTTDKALKCLESEVKTYDQYLRGEVYGYTVSAPYYKEGELDITDEEALGAWDHWEDDHLDSCWGFYGNYGDMISEAKTDIDYMVKVVTTQEEMAA